jgi:hypothetical protein
MVGQTQQATTTQIAALTEQIEKREAAIPTRLPVDYADRELKEDLSRALRRRNFAQVDTPADLGLSQVLGLGQVPLLPPTQGLAEFLAFLAGLRSDTPELATVPRRSDCGRRAA